MQTETAQVPDYFSRDIIRANRFYRRPEGEFFAVLAGGRESCAPGYRIDRSDFPYYALEFVVAGRGTLKLGEEQCEIAAGSVFCYGPGIPHRIINNREGVLEKFFFNVRGPGAAQLLDRDLQLTGKVLHSTQSAALFSLFEELIHQGLENGPWSDRICNALVEALACKAAAGALEPGSSKSTAFARFQQCKNYIGKYGTGVPGLRGQPLLSLPPFQAV
jgi:quercetin dioxygenase-like cupin family protein